MDARTFFVHARQHVATILLAIVVLSSLTGYIEIPDAVYLYLEKNTITGALVVTVLMFLATVIAPIALLPMIPLISPVLGPFVTGLSCWLGWTLGSVLAFWIARHGGRPLLKRFVATDRIERYQSRIPENSHFLLIFALRLVTPVDVLSYLLGLFSPVSMRTYTIASALGILWFSFAFSYLGQAFKNTDTVLFVGYSVASVIIFCTALWYVRRTLRSESNKK